jgi:rod shape-determining protein MreD
MIKRVIINTLIISFAVLLQSTVIQHVAVYGVIPDIVLIIVLFFSLKEGSKVGELTGFFGGILIDFLSLSPLGFHGFIYCVIGFLTGLTNKNISTDSILTQFLFIFSSLLLKGLLATITIVLFSIETTSLSFLSRNFFLELAYTVLVTPLFFLFANKLYSLSHRRRAGF